MWVDVSKGGWVDEMVEWVDGRVFEQVSGRVDRRKGGEWLGVGLRV